jgi:hypothetical protein
MDWLRSEDLKKEKAVTTSNSSVSRPEGICSFQIELVVVSICLPYCHRLNVIIK